MSWGVLWRHEAELSSRVQDRAALEARLGETSAKWSHDVEELELQSDEQRSAIDALLAQVSWEVAGGVMRCHELQSDEQRAAIDALLAQAGGGRGCRGWVIPTERERERESERESERERARERERERERSGDGW